MQPSVDVLICGAGIAGISAAYHLAVRHGVPRVLLVDNRPPLSLTSDKSTECYRNWWPDEAMVALMNRSIDVMEELARQSGNVFHLNRRGYLYLTANPFTLEAFIKTAAEPASLGAGPLRIHRGRANDPPYQPAPSEGFENQPIGADLILDRDLILGHFPYLSEKVIAALHVRRAGWFSAQQLGMYLLEQGRACGVQLLNARVCGVHAPNGKVENIQLSDGSTVATQHFVIAAGPFLKEVADLLGIDLPVYCELHVKAAFRDPLEIMPRQAPLLIWNDPQYLPWSPEERAFLSEDEETRWLLDEMPAGVHTRPEGGPDSDIFLGLWEYRPQEMDTPIFPVPLDQHYPEIVLRGLTTILPGLKAYLDKLPRPKLDWGYYTKTPEGLSGQIAAPETGRGILHQNPREPSLDWSLARERGLHYWGTLRLWADGLLCCRRTACCPCQWQPFARLCTCLLPRTLRRSPISAPDARLA